MEDTTAEKVLHLLAGEWSGAGRGEYPTIEAFEYLDSIRFVIDDGRPTLFYESKTHHRHAGETEYQEAHWEAGFLRVVSDIEVELSDVQNAGRAEILKGIVELTPTGAIVRLQSAAFANDPRMVATSRTITVDGDTLHYTTDMHTTSVGELMFHVEATLSRQ